MGEMDKMLHFYSEILSFSQWGPIPFSLEFQEGFGREILFPLPLLAMEALSRTLRMANEGGFISRFGVGRKGGEGMEVSYFLFSDDTLNFCDANQEQLMYLS